MLLSFHRVPPGDRRKRRRLAPDSSWRSVVRIGFRKERHGWAERAPTDLSSQKRANKVWDLGQGRVWLKNISKYVEPTKNSIEARKHLRVYIKLPFFSKIKLLTLDRVRVLFFSAISHKPDDETIYNFLFEYYILLNNIYLFYIISDFFHVFKHF